MTGFSPHVFTVRLSASDVPLGTSSRVRLGMLASESRNCSSSEAAALSSSSSSSFRARVSSISAEAASLEAGPAFFSTPTRWLSSLRRAFSRSDVVIASRRLWSRARKSPSKAAGSAPRARSFPSTTSRLALTNPRSSIALIVYSTVVSIRMGRVFRSGQTWVGKRMYAGVRTIAVPRHTSHLQRKSATSCPDG